MHDHRENLETKARVESERLDNGLLLTKSLLRLLSCLTDYGSCDSLLAEIKSYWILVSWPIDYGTYNILLLWTYSFWRLLS